jgi:hypothetical protein
MRHSETRRIADVMVSSSQIREQTALFLDKRVDLDSFEDWLVQNTWNIHLSGSSAAEALTFAIEESLAEHSSGHIGDDELRKELNQLVHRDNIFMVFSTAPQLRSSWIMSSPSLAAVFSRP